MQNKYKKVTDRLSRNKDICIFKQDKGYHIKNTVQNFSSYQLSTDECTGLSDGLDHPIPARCTNNRIHTEFEQFYHGILRDISHIPEHYLLSLKTKLRNTCEKYSKICIK